jgi:hypothetical protein
MAKWRIISKNGVHLTALDNTNGISESVKPENPTTSSKFMMTTSKILIITSEPKISESTITVSTGKSIIEKQIVKNAVLSLVYCISGAINDLDSFILLGNRAVGMACYLAGASQTTRSSTRPG